MVSVVKIDKDKLKLYVSILSQLIDFLGTVMLVSDHRDLGKFDRIHHWQVGWFLKFISYAIDILSSVANQLGELTTKLREFIIILTEAKKKSS